MWTPKQNTFDVSRVVENLFDYLEEQQEDALIWADPERNLKPIAKFYPSAVGRVKTIFPSVSLLDKSLETDDSEDMLVGDLRLRFETVIQGGDSDALVKDAESYAAALDTMLANVSSETLCKGSKTPEMEAGNLTRDVRFFVISPGTNNIYFQVFHTEVTYRLNASTDI